MFTSLQAKATDILSLFPFWNIREFGTNASFCTTKLRAIDTTRNRETVFELIFKFLSGNINEMTSNEKKEQSAAFYTL